MLKKWSLSARLISIVALTISIVLALFVSLTVFRLQDGALTQRTAIGSLARERFDAQLQVEAQLASSFLDGILHDVELAVAGLAKRSETQKAIIRGNIVSIDLLMKKAVTTAPLDGILALDKDLFAVGSHLPGLNLIAANKAVRGSRLNEMIRELVNNQNPDAPRLHIAYQPGDQNLIEALGLKFVPEALLLTAIHPVFDDFGDVSGLLIGHRVVTGKEERLSSFVASRKLSVELRDKKRVLMRSGPTLQPARALTHCHIFIRVWQFCIAAPREHLENQTAELVQFIEDEKASFTRWLVWLSILSLVAAIVMAFTATNLVLAPLAQITRVVRSVAKGNWLAKVAGQKRRDEVGEIARAVVVLQRSVKEREKLQADVVDVEQIYRQRTELTEAMHTCRSGLRQRMFGISDLVENIEENARKLESDTGLAEAEADEARLVALRASGANGSQSAKSDSALICDAIDRVRETLTIIAQDGNNTTGEIDKLTQEIRGLDHVVKRFLSELDAIPELSGRALHSTKLLEPA